MTRIGLPDVPTVPEILDALNVVEMAYAYTGKRSRSGVCFTFPLHEFPADGEESWPSRHRAKRRTDKSTRALASRLDAVHRWHQTNPCSV